MQGELRNIEEAEKVDVLFIDTAVDFLRTYADRCHHGKEEDILFRDLAKKDVDPKHKRTMDELLEEHVFARENVGALYDARLTYSRGDLGAAGEIGKRLKALADLYPRHIEKEDKHFFVPCMAYFSREEMDAMLDEFFEFDRKMIHDKYKAVVDKVEKERKPG
ncbi:MAG: hemerythrin domain-containing protein [Methanomassiliicoccales archaeon]|nr:hemerythrin domain-containing protein [Methanomassiliicoccales archaeon]